MPITFGSTSAPSNITQYLDSVFGTSLANYREQLIDNIGAINAFLFKLLKSDFYESCDGGAFIQEPLMYGLTPADSYDGWDELGTLPTDGITDAIYEWRQCAAAITYNMKEVYQNQHKIVSLVKSRIMQGEMGLQEYFQQALWWGSGDGALKTPKVSTINGSNSIEFMAKLVDYASSGTGMVGNLDQSLSTNSWWRNKSFTSAAATYDNLMLEINQSYTNTSLGTGGPVDLMPMDEITYELFTQAYWLKYRVVNDGDPNFPFENKKFRNALIVLEDKVPDVANNLVSAAAKGSIYFLNTKFFRIRYHPERNFEMLKDEQGRTFAKPINGDSRIGHLAWMGNVTTNNRRKQGVRGNIARTLT